MNLGKMGAVVRGLILGRDEGRRLIVAMSSYLNDCYQEDGPSLRPSVETIDIL